MKIHISDQAGAVTINGSQVLTPGQTAFQSICLPGSFSNLLRIYAISLKRDDSNNFKEIASVSKTSLSVDVSLSRIAFVTGSVTSVDDAYLNLTIETSKTSCDDATSYRRQLTGATAGNYAYIAKADMNVDIKGKKCKKDRYKENKLSFCH